MKPWWLFKVLKVLAFASAATLGLGLVVMALWNALVPELFKGPVLSFWQAVGLLVLSHLLLRGWGGRCGREWRHEHWRRRFEEKLAGMSPQEREAFRAEGEHWWGWCPGERRAPEAPPQKESP